MALPLAPLQPYSSFRIQHSSFGCSFGFRRVRLVRARREGREETEEEEKGKKRRLLAFKAGAEPQW
jgi:hypothetical protein